MLSVEAQSPQNKRFQGVTLQTVWLGSIISSSFCWLNKSCAPPRSEG